MKKTLLDLLKDKKSEFITCDYLSKKLCLSLDNIRRELEELEELGYEIQFVPHHGLKLTKTPDKLIAEEIRYNLKTKLLGKYIFCYNKVNSTNDIAGRLAKDIGEEGIVVLAESQTKGRGRRDRFWSSPEGGLYMSLVLKPDNNPEELAKFYILSSVAVAGALRKITGASFLIKWPNDIVVQDKKVSGILAEGSISNNKLEYLILGIGVNVNVGSDKLPDGSTSILDETGKVYLKSEIAKVILEEIEKEYLVFKKEGIESLAEKWHSLSSCLGSKVF